MKKTLAAALVAAAALAVGAAPAVAKDWKTVRIATEGAYMPWNGTDATGKLIGFEIELAAELCKKAGVTCEIKAQDWDGIIPGLQQGKYDAIMAGMSITDERRKLIEFSRPYAADPAIFAALSGSPLLTQKAGGRVDLSDAASPAKAAFDTLEKALKGKSVGVQVSTIHQTMMEKHLSGLSLRTYDKTDSMALDLASGRIDAMLSDRSVISDLQKAGDGKNIAFFGPGFVGGVLGEGMGVGLRKADPELKALFDKAILAANADGTTSKLAEKWFGYDVAAK